MTNAGDPGAGFVPETTLPVHGLARYLRVRLAVTDGVLCWEVPRSLLGIVPLGTRRLRLPLPEVRGVRLRRGWHPVRLVLGLAAIVLPLVFGLWWVAVPLVVLGLWVALASLGPHLEVESLSGKRWRAGVCFGHQFDAGLYADAVNDLAARARRGPAA